MPVEDQGVTPGRFQVIPRTLIFLFDGDRVLLIKGAAHKRLWANRYNGVGGHIERGEDVITSAIRELFEETGLKDQDLWLCGTVMVDTGQNTGIVLFVLKGRYTGGQIVPSHEGSLDWVSLDLVPGLSGVEDLTIMVNRVAKMHVGDPTFSARSGYSSGGELVVSFSS